MKSSQFTRLFVKGCLLTTTSITALLLTSCLGGGGGNNSISTGGGGGSGSGNGGGSTTYTVTGGMFTQHNDTFRMGRNLTETTLNRTNVPASFGLIGHLPAVGQVYAQPLVANIKTATGNQSLLFVATEADVIYAYDITSPQTIAAKTVVWTHSYVDLCNKVIGNSCRLPTPLDVDAPNVSPTVGITATPVIDPDGETIYFTSMIFENNTPKWYLHALDLLTGAERTNSPVLISGSYPGTGAAAIVGSSGTSMVPFTPLTQLSRAGLVFNNGQVTVAFTSFDDGEPAHGWVFTYDATTLENVGIWNSTPNSGLGTIWMSGSAPAVDTDGSLFFATGNDDPAPSYLGIPDFSDSIVKLALPILGAIPTLAYGPTNTATDFFTPYNHITLAANDVEVGSGGVILLPDEAGSTQIPHLVMGGGKQGTLYLLNRNKLGQETLNTAADDNVVQEIVGDPTLVGATGIPGGKDFGPGLYGTPAYYNHKVFIAASGDYLRALPISNAFLDWGSMTYTSYKNPVRGSTPTISASGSATSDAIVWIVDVSSYTYQWTPGSYPPTTKNGSAILRAYSTDDLSTPLFTSAVTKVASPSVPTTANPTASQNDDNCAGLATGAAGCATKFVVPTVQNGMVFVGTDTEVSVFGLMQ